MHLGRAGGIDHSRCPDLYKAPPQGISGGKTGVFILYFASVGN